MKVAILTSDARETYHEYGRKAPYFGTAPQGLLSGFASMPEGHELRNGKCEMGKAEKRGLKAETGNLKADGKYQESEHVISSSQPSSFKSQVSPFEIHVLSCTQRPMESPEKLADNIWFHSLHVPKWGWLRSGYLGCILAVRKKLREIQPDLVHAQGTERDCAISAICTPYPKLLTIHGNLRLIRRTVGFRPFSAMWFQSIIEGFVVPRFDGIICITNYTKSAVEHEAKRTWVVPNAVDPAFLELGERRERLKAESGNLKPESASLNLELLPKTADTQVSNLRPRVSALTQVSSLNSQVSSPPPVVLVVANVDARKNQNSFILALDSLARETPFLLKFFGRCGDDEYGREFRNLIAERPWCHHGGMIGRVELREEFARASILALPTHEDNCPMVVLEAQAAGIPVMASNVGGVPDLIEHGVTGLLTDPTHPETMRVALKRMLDDRDLVEHLAENGRRQATHRFHPRVIAETHLHIYREMTETQKDIENPVSPIV